MGRRFAAAATVKQERHNLQPLHLLSSDGF